MKYEIEIQLLEEMLTRDEAAKDGLLSERESEAFPDMLSLLQAGKDLSKPQRKWIMTSAKRLGLIADESSNPFSAMPQAEQQEHKRRAAGVRLPWEAPGYERPLKPPGRRPA